MLLLPKSFANEFARLVNPDADDPVSIKLVLSLPVLLSNELAILPDADPVSVPNPLAPGVASIVPLLVIGDRPISCAVCALYALDKLKSPNP